MGIHELLVNSDEIKEMIQKRATVEEIAAASPWPTA